MSDSDDSRFLSLFDAENVSPDSQRQRGGSDDEPVAYFAGGSGKLADILEANETAAIGQVGGGKSSRKNKKSRKSKRTNRKRKPKTYRRRR